jgi:nucleolin
MTAKLFVASLSWSVTEADLHALFGSVGHVLSVAIPTRREDGKPRGFAFVEMATVEEGQQAIQHFDQYLLDNRPLSVSFQDESRGRGGSPYGGRASHQTAATGQSQSSAAPNAKLFVRGLARSVSEDDLTRLFQQMGTVFSARIPMDRDTGEAKGFAFVEMGSIEEAQAALNALNGTIIDGKALAIDFQDPNRPKSPKPGGFGRPGGGGGYGGGRRDSYTPRW